MLRSLTLLVFCLCLAGPARAKTEEHLKIKKCSLKTVLLPAPLPEAEIIVIVLGEKAPLVRRSIRKVEITLELSRYLPAKAVGPHLLIQAGEQTADSLRQNAGSVSAYLDSMPEDKDLITMSLDLVQATLPVSRCATPEKLSLGEPGRSGP